MSQARAPNVWVLFFLALSFVAFLPPIDYRLVSNIGSIRPYRFHVGSADWRRDANLLATGRAALLAYVERRIRIGGTCLVRRTPRWNVLSVLLHHSPNHSLTRKHSRKLDKVSGLLV